MNKVHASLLALLLLAAAVLIGQPVAHSNQATNQMPTRWEYLTETVEANVLQAKLNEWASSHWEVFSIAESDRALETTDKPRIHVEKFQVTAKRAVR